ncbi:hypothetical protein MMC10_007102 [Thelotrema lepadinum]|nr:hypothetical protein [Thelotrema lepadinum]
MRIQELRKRRRGPRLLGGAAGASTQASQIINPSQTQATPSLRTEPDPIVSRDSYSPADTGQYRGLSSSHPIRPTNPVERGSTSSQSSLETPPVARITPSSQESLKTPPPLAMDTQQTAQDTAQSSSPSSPA